MRRGPVTARMLSRAAFVAGAWALWTTPTRAQVKQTDGAVSAEDLGARAVAAGQEGLALYEKGRWTEALARFQEADSLYHSPVFELFVARCLRNSDQLLAARRVFRNVLLTKLETNAPEAFRDAQHEAEGELAALEAEIPSVLVVIHGASPNVQLHTAGGSLRPGQVTELDPGQHTIQATDGARTERVSLTLLRGSKSRVVRLDFAPARKAEPERANWLPPVLTFAGAGLVVAGGVTGAFMLSERGDAESKLPGSGCLGTTCPVSQQGRFDQLESEITTLGQVSTGLLLGGVVMTGVGLYLWLSDDQEAPRQSSAGRPLTLVF